MAGLYCRSCGAAVARNATFCSECGVRSPSVKNPLSTFDGPPLERPRTSASSHRRGSQGLILGVVGSCFGILGIFTLGLIFVPLALLSSVVGLVRGLANRCTAGTAMSIFGVTLSVIGFFASPSLMLLAGVLFVAGQTNNPPSKEVRSASSDESERLPLQERRFCEIISSASAKYADLARDAKNARDDKNGVLEKRAEDAMTSTARDRNADIFKLAQESNFKFEKWGVELLKVGSPNEKRVTFSVRPLCSDIVTIHVTAAPNGSLLETLAAKRKGEAFLVSGTFVGTRADNDAPPTVPDAKRFEISITERGSMQEPEYWALLR